jgi:hypothetical protein
MKKLIVLFKLIVITSFVLSVSFFNDVLPKKVQKDLNHFQSQRKSQRKSQFQQKKNPPTNLQIIRRKKTFQDHLEDRLSKLIKEVSEIADELTKSIETKEVQNEIQKRSQQSEQASKRAESNARSSSRGGGRNYFPSSSSYRPGSGRSSNWNRERSPYSGFGRSSWGSNSWGGSPYGRSSSPYSHSRSPFGKTSSLSSPFSSNKQISGKKKSSKISDTKEQPLFFSENSDAKLDKKEEQKKQRQTNIVKNALEPITKKMSELNEEIKKANKKPDYKKIAQSIPTINKDIEKLKEKSLELDSKEIKEIKRRNAKTTYKNFYPNFLQSFNDPQTNAADFAKLNDEITGTIGKNVALEQRGKYLNEFIKSKEKEIKKIKKLGGQQSTQAQQVEIKDSLEKVKKDFPEVEDYKDKIDALIKQIS